MPFIGFAEAYVLSAFRRAGVPLQRIRPAVDVLSSEIGLEHALASKKLYTDGAEVLYDYAVKRERRRTPRPRRGPDQAASVLRPRQGLPETYPLRRRRLGRGRRTADVSLGRRAR